MNQNCFLARILRFLGTSLFACTFIFSIFSHFNETVNAENEKPTGEKSAIFWVSSPITVGSTGLICGGNFTSDVQIQVTVKNAENTGKTYTVEPLRVSKTSIFFRMPTNDEAEIAVICASGKTEQFYVNRPKVWWIQGDQGRKALSHRVRTRRFREERYL